MGWGVAPSLLAPLIQLAKTPEVTTPAWVIVATIIATIVAGGIGSWVTAWWQRNKSKEDTAQVVRSTYSAMLSDLRLELEEREKRCQRVTDELSWQLKAALEEIVRLGGDPHRLRPDFLSEPLALPLALPPAPDADGA